MSNYVRAYLFLGSACSGKTTVIRKLTRILHIKGWDVISIGININHGVAYLITRFIVSISQYRYFGNYYLTLRFNNSDRFCKYMPLMMFLDTLFIPIKYTVLLLRVKQLSHRGKNVFVLIDEYYPNAVIDYTYFVSKLCKNTRKLTNFIHKIFYKIAISYTHKTFNFMKVILIIMISSDPQITIDLWQSREKSRIFDYNHFLYRTAGVIVLRNYLKGYIRVMVYKVYDPRREGINVVKTLLRDMVSEKYGDLLCLNP
jgi:hypothetical protein